MHTNVILTNKRRIHVQSSYTNTKLKAWFRRLLCHPAKKQSGSTLHWYIPTDPHGGSVCTLWIKYGLESSYWPNQAWCSPCTSMARPKSASFTAAPFTLLANSRFSGYRRTTTTAQPTYSTPVITHTGHIAMDRPNQISTLSHSHLPAPIVNGREKL